MNDTLKINMSHDGTEDSYIEIARTAAEEDLSSLKDSLQSIKSLKPDCDKLDYALAASIGVLCGVIDIFLVAKPGDSPIETMTDKWFSDRTLDFAKFCGWKETNQISLSSAISFLENKFKIPYDQRGAGDAAGIIFNLNPKNHHFKSLGHNPTLLGLFFSILDQFTNQSHFISGGKLLSIQNADYGFSLYGTSIPAKLFSGFVNWFGHLISDISGSSSSNGRGMGIPSPFWSWINSVIAIKSQLNLPIGEFDKYVLELAVKIYEKGFDFRFQSIQLIPVFINEITVRLLYAIRRMCNYFATTNKKEVSLANIWKTCEPFSNPTIKRMLTVAHGTFCLIDLSEAAIRELTTNPGYFDSAEFFIRLNLPGIERLTISLFGELNRALTMQKAKTDAQFTQQKMEILNNYLDGLSLLSELYNDQELVDFVNNFKQNDMYIQAFKKSVVLAELRQVPKDKILKTKADIDLYFRRN